MQSNNNTEFSNALSNSSDRSPLSVSKRLYHVWPLSIAAVMVIVLFIKAFGVPAPIFSSDEYAYWRNGVMLGDREALYEADPRMQQINNKAYCMLLSACNRLSPGNLILPSLLNTAAWAATLVVLFFTARHLMRTRDAALAVAATSLLPSGLSAGTLMPDTLFGLGFWLILFIIVRNLDLWRELVCVFILLAVLLAIKPHAIALVGAYLMYFFTRMPRIHSLGFVSALRKYALMLGLAAIVFGATNLLIKVIVPDYNNAATIGFGATYNSLLAKAMSLDFLLQNIWLFFQCMVRHVSILMMIFSLPLAYIIISSFNFKEGSSFYLTQRSRHISCFSRFISITFLLVLCMVTIFSILAGLSNDFEQNRLHVRYYWYLLPALIVAGFAASNYLSVRLWLGGVAGGISIVGLIVYQLFAKKGLSIYPWDCPDLFALYNPINSSWVYPAPISFTEHIIFTLVMLAAIIVLFRPRLAWILGMIVLCITFSLSWINVLDWQRGASREHANRLDKARALGLLLGNARIQAIGSNPYGPFTASLFGLAGNPLVSILPKQKIESSDILPNAEAVLIEGPHEFMGTYAWKVADNTIAIYALIDRSGFSIARSFLKQTGFESKTLLCQFGEANKNISLFGFNQPEPWGAWSAKSGAEIVLPHSLRGRVRVTWRGWVPKELGPSDVTLQIGDGVISQSMSIEPSEHSQECLVGDFADRIFVTSKIHQPYPWSRPLGVAFQSIKLESID